MRIINKPTKINVRTVKGVVSDQNAKIQAVAMRDLYKECVSQLINQGSMKFHVLMMPSMMGNHFTYAMRDEDGFDQAIADLLNVQVLRSDCVVILGHDILTSDLSEDQMMEIVIADVALHIDRLSPVADKSTGWVGSYIGWSTVAAVLAAAHPVLRMLEPEIFLNDRIKNAGIISIIQDQRTPKSDSQKHRAAFQAIEEICTMVDDEKGGFITLPATGAEISSAAIAFFHEVVNRMENPPRSE